MKAKFIFQIGILMLVLVMLEIQATTNPQLTRAAGPWYVATDGSDSNSCQDPSEPCATINGAIGKATSGDTIYVATGTYTGSGAQVVLINKSLTFSGGWASGFSQQNGWSIIDAEGTRVVVVVNSGNTVILERWIIQNGLGGSLGGSGGIRNSGILTLNQSVVRYNQNGYGGITNSQGVLVLNHSAVRENKGRGIFNYLGQVTLNSSTIDGSEDGSGILNAGTLVLNNSTVSNNKAVGGIHNDYLGTVTLNNSTVSGNSANSNAGGISNNGILVLNNASIIGNTSISGSGGGLYRGSGTVTIQNSIIANNNALTGPDCAGQITSAGYNLIEDTSGCTITSTIGDLTNQDALLGALVGPGDFPPYHPLLQGSPAINAGNPGGCQGSSGTLTTDQRGASRSDRCDIGAYEYKIPGPAAVVSALSDQTQHTLPSTAFPEAFQVAVLDDIGSPVGGAEVVFQAPPSGASGIFSATGTISTTITTTETGIVMPSSFFANSIQGSYQVTATEEESAGSIYFSLWNTMGWYVSLDGNDINDCLVATTPCSTILGVLNNLEFIPGETIFVAQGIYVGGKNTGLLFRKSVGLSGGWENNFAKISGITILDGQNIRGGIAINSDAWIDRFKIQNTIYGGISNSGTLTLTLSEIIGSKGGGIYNSGEMLIDECNISNNTSTSSGGGITNYGALVVFRSAVTRNVSQSGISGIYNTGTLSINSSTISSNEGEEGGGVKNAYGGNTRLRNVTISQNKATTGAGLYNTGGSVTLQNTLIAGNIGQDCNGSITSEGYNLIGYISGCTYSSGTGDLIGVDPQLRTLIGSLAYHPLESESPAIDAGNPAGCQDNLGNPLLTDQRNSRRVDRCDIGAIEWNPLDSSTKLSDVPKAPPGSQVSYQIELNNPGETDIFNLKITDTLPLEITLITGTLNATMGDFGFAGGVITWTGTLSADSTIEIYFNATVNSDVPLGKLVTNLAKLQGDNLTSDISSDVIVGGRLCNLVKYSGNPVLVRGPAGAWDSQSVWESSVIKVDGLYRMWYTGKAGIGYSEIGYATSPDGVHWTKSSGNPVLIPEHNWEYYSISAPDVIFENNIYLMWYAGGSGHEIHIGYATSPNGTIWTKFPYAQPVLPAGSLGSWDDKGVSNPTVMKIGKVYHMWYTGSDGSRYRLGHATASSAFGPWLKDSANPVLDLGPIGAWDWLSAYSSSVVKNGDEYLLWYSGITLPPKYQIGTAFSSNGNNWQRQGWLIPPGGAGAFDRFGVEDPSVLLEDSDFKIWYSGTDANGVSSIGHASVGVCPMSLPVGNKVFLPLVKNEKPAYYDDFSDPDSGWVKYEDDFYKLAYNGGEYQMRVKYPYGGIFVTPGALADDFTALVSTRLASGNGDFGIVFGIDDSMSQFYEVILHSNQYSIWRYDSGWVMLKDWTTSSSIGAASSTNWLKVTREGANISVYANDKFLTTVVDSTFSGLRRIGLIVESSSQPADVRFDNFSMYPVGNGFSTTVYGVNGGFENEVYYSTNEILIPTAPNIMSDWQSLDFSSRNKLKR